VRTVSKSQKEDVGAFAVVQPEVLQFRQAQVSEPCVFADVQFDVSERERGQGFKGPFLTRRGAREMREEALEELFLCRHTALSMCELCSIDPVACVNLQPVDFRRFATRQSNAAQ